MLTGVCDRTVCVHCGGGLEHWEVTDDAFAEHAFYFPFCFYVRYLKGPSMFTNVDASCHPQRKNKAVFLCNTFSWLNKPEFIHFTFFKKKVSPITHI